MLISNSIKDAVISHCEFLEILKEKKEYDCLKIDFLSKIIINNENLLYCI